MKVTATICLNLQIIEYFRKGFQWNSYLNNTETKHFAKLWGAAWKGNNVSQQ